MEDANIFIPFTNVEVSDEAYLILEQDDYPENTQLTMLDVVRILTQVISATESTPYSNDCLMSDDGKSFVTTVSVYPYPLELSYTVGVTNGVVSRSGSDEVTKIETLQFSLDNVVNMKYPILNFISGRWIGDTYLADGTVVNTPSVTVDGQEIHTLEKIYGTYEVEYTTWMQKLTINISVRDDAVENFFQSVLYATFEYGIELIDIEPPPNAEENYANGIDCNGNTFEDGEDEVEIIDDDDPYIPKATPVNETITLNYCEDFGNG